jgi:hypothetical protein
MPQATGHSADRINSVGVTLRRGVRRLARRLRKLLIVCLTAWTAFTFVVPQPVLFGNPPGGIGGNSCGGAGNGGGAGGGGAGGGLAMAAPKSEACVNGQCGGGSAGGPGGGPGGGGGFGGGKNPGSCDCPIKGAAVSDWPVNLRYGIAVEQATDLGIPAVGGIWSGTRSYASNATGATTNGNKWLTNHNEARLIQQGSNISLQADAATQRVFTYNSGSGTYTGPADSFLTLTADTANHRFLLADRSDNLWWTFNDFSGTYTTALRGKVTERSTLQLHAQSLSGTTWSYNTDGTVNQITTASGQDYSVSFTYGGGYITRIQVKDASGNLLQQVDYTYYQSVTSPSSDIGTTNDLVQVKVATKATSDASGTLSIIRYTQYRYGGGSLLKGVYEHDAVQRIMSTLSLATPESVMSQPDSYGAPHLNTFASRGFTYYSSNASTASVNTQFASAENLNTTYGGSDIDETNYVASETIGGCGSCGAAGSITKNYYYTGLNGTSTDPNVVVRLVIEDTLDSAGTAVYRTIHGLENSGRSLRQAFIQDPTGTPAYWCESWTMATSTGADYRVSRRRAPSAHTGVTSAANLRSFLNPYDGSSWSNDTGTVNSSSGLIESFSYSSSGMTTDAFVQNGSGGTAYYVAAADYGDSVNTTLPTAIYDYPAQTTTRTNGIQTTYSYTFYDPGINQQIKTRTTTLPVIPTTQNGSGVATTTSEYYDTLGRLRWTQDGEGYISYTSYNPTTGAAAYAAVDVNPASPGSEITSGSTGNWDAVTVGGADSNQPTRGGSLPTPLALATKTYYDAQGWMTRTTDPSGAEHYIAYANTQTIRFPYWDSGASRCLVPIQVTQFNNGGQVTDQISVRATDTAISTSGSAPTGFSTAPGQSDYVAWTRNTYDSVGRLSYVDQYATIPGSGTGTLGGDFYREVTQYDTMGRRQYLIQVVRGSASNNRVEQVTKVDYDLRNRVIQISQGVSGDTAANSQDMTDSYNVYPTLVIVAKTEYDAGGVGDGYVTKSKRYFGTGANDFTGANYKRAYRGHSRGVEPFYMNGSTETPVGPYPVTDVDWKGRTTASALYETDPSWSSVLTGDGYAAYAVSTSSHRRTRRDTLYDDLGRVYQVKVYEIASSSGTGTNYLSTRLYYDRNGRLAASGADYANGTEVAYDAAGRQYQSRTVVALQSTPYSSGAFNYRTPVPNPSLGSMTGGDGGLIAFSHAVFDANGNVAERDSFEANHDDLTGTAVGVDLTNNDDYVRQTVFNWYDSAGRLTTTADYGSGDTTSGAGQWRYAAPPTRPSSAPTASGDTALVTLFSYNADSGLHELLTNPAGTPTKTFYDRLGRVTYVAENYSDFNASTEAGTGDSTDKSKDKVTKNVYDGPSRLKQLIAMDPNADGSLSDNQVTNYLYEDAVDAARRTNEIYPDSTDTTSSGTNQVKLAYNVDGSLSQRTDQRGTVLAYAYKNNRLLASQSATTLGTGVDGAVQSIAYGYDNLNRKQNVTSTSGAGGTGTVVNDVQFAYNDFGQVTTTYQSHSGAVNPSTTPNVQYTYDTTTSSSVFSAQHRPQTIVYPNGRTVYYDYGTSGSAYDVLSKVRTIRDTGASGTALATYDYNGAGSRLALVTLPEPSLKLDLFQGTSGTYAGLDRFGRVVDQYWKGYGSTSDADRIHYGYDYAGSRTYRDIDSAIYSTNDKDQAYTYDGLHRLETLQQGTLSGSSISGTPASEEDWTLDAVGNWPNYVTKAAGTTTLNQGRTVNAANEITAISASVGATWATPAYDAAGNMTTIPQPANLTSGYAATYDPWNRLVKLADGSNTVQENQYDGRNFRTVIKSYTSGTLSETRHSYFTDDWRCVEERVGTAATAERQFVWGERYVDELILRDRDTDTNGSLDERLYAAQDANWNVTAVVNVSGAVQERFLYAGYGVPAFLNSTFSAISASGYAWETLLGGYRYDSLIRFYAVRYRVFHPLVGSWCQRDPLGYVDGANVYAAWFLPGGTDPTGLGWWLDIKYHWEGYKYYVKNPTVMDPGLQMGQKIALGTAAIAGGGAAGLAAGGAVVASELAAGATAAEASAAGTAFGTSIGATTGYLIGSPLGEDVANIGAVGGGLAGGIGAGNAAAGRCSKGNVGFGRPLGEKPGSAPVGSRSQQIPSIDGNPPTTINGRPYSGHAIDRIQGRGLTPSVIDDTIQPGNLVGPGNTPGTTMYYNSVNRVTVIVNNVTGSVITVW